MKTLFVLLILTMVVSASFAQTTHCRPDGRGGWICTPQSPCMPGTRC